MGETLVEAAVRQGLRRRTGIVVGLLDGRDRFVRAGGTLAADSLVEIGSVTKVFTALLLADAVVRGDLDLDTPVRDLLPPGTSVPSRDGAQITLEHLATHRSGLPRSPAGLSVPRATVDFFRGRNPYAGFGEAELLAGLGGTTLKRTPGTGSPAYSNTGFALLGAALAHAAGTSYDVLVRDRVCLPLGLHDTVTSVTATAGHRSRWASGHRPRGGPAEDWTVTGIAGAGALRSTVSDQLAFLAAQLDPDSTPLAGAIRLAQRPRVVTKRVGQALGWMHAGQEPPLWWHNGGTGGFRSCIAFVPSRGRAVVALTDTGRGVDLIALRLLRDLDRA